jgi:hypothetical protein
VRPNFRRARPEFYLDFLPNFPPKHRPVVPSVPPLCASAPPVKGVLSLTTNTRKLFLTEKRKNLKISPQTKNNQTKTKH